MQRYIVSHTSMRGIAALLVVFYHLQFGTANRLVWETATPFFKLGYLWVDLFFILSGFVISYSARADERAPYSWPQIKDFWVHRIARIYPLHLFALFALLIVIVGEEMLLRAIGSHSPTGDPFSRQSISGFIAQIFLLHVWGIGGPVIWNIPSWSISAELVAYLVFPALAALLARWRGVALAAMILLPVLFYLWVGLTTGVLDIVQGVAILRCLAGFSLGMMLYATRARTAALGDGALGAMQAAGLAFVLTTMLLGLNDVWVMPGFVLLIAATWPDRGWLAVPLRTAPMHWLGEISYSVYLNHFWVLTSWLFVSTRLLTRLAVSPALGRAIILAGGIGFVLIVSHLTYRFIETPARKAIVAAYRARATGAGRAAR